MMTIESWGITNPGAVRKYNEDNLLSRPELGLWMVADGAGGHASGEVASGMIAEVLAQLPAGLSAGELVSQIRWSLTEVHRALRAKAMARGPDVMIASTFVALVLRDGQYTCLWAGDSRAYLLRNSVLAQITRDHSLVQELVDLGRLKQEDAENHPHANVITRAVGADSDGLELDIVTGTADPGDRFLLCSDGLTKTMTLVEITKELSNDDPSRSAQSLIDEALARRVRDNVTALVIAISSDVSKK